MKQRTINILLFTLATVAIWLAIFLVAIKMHAAETNVYKVVTVAQLIGENPADWQVIQTHIIVQAYIIGQKAQGDGDTHMVACDAPTFVMTADGSPPDALHCFVAEQSHAIRCFAFPSYPTKLVNIKGISRYDAQNPGHHWWEIHPVEMIKYVDGTLAPECFVKGIPSLPNDTPIVTTRP